MLLTFGEELIWPFLAVCSTECLALGVLSSWVLCSSDLSLCSLLQGVIAALIRTSLKCVGLMNLTTNFFRGYGL